MEFIYKNPCLYGGIIVHDRFYLFNPCVKDPNPDHAAIIHNTTDNWENSPLTERKVSSSVFPDYLLNTFLVLVRTGLHYNEAILLCLGKFLTHVIIANCCHWKSLRDHNFQLA
jgi:hypothetical protein